MKKLIISILPLLSLFTAQAPVINIPYFSETIIEQAVELAEESLTIMWDLGGTLVDVNRMLFAGELGTIDAALYFIFDAGFDKNKIQARLFEILEILGGAQEGANEHKCTYGAGMYLPKIMALWVAGAFDENPEAFVQDLEDGVDQLYEEGFFINKREYRIVRKAMRAMFAPEIMAQYQELIKPMYKLLERINHDVHTCMILSNWDAASFEIFINSPCGKKLTQYIDPKNIVISGAIGLNKPHPSFFEYVLYTYKLDPANCIFIDNDAANCATARSCGIHAINFTGNVKHVEQELINRNILN
jgi:HAD superfamily hydrolase (TIGR01509 family)